MLIPVATEMIPMAPLAMEFEMSMCDVWREVVKMLREGKKEKKAR
jgi:hypothetical protein